MQQWEDLNNLYVKLHKLDNELDKLAKQSLEGGFSAHYSPEKFDQSVEELKRLEFIKHKLFKRYLNERFDLTWFDRHSLINEFKRVTDEILDLEEEIEHTIKWNKLNKEIDKVSEKNL